MRDPEFEPDPWQPVVLDPSDANKHDQLTTLRARAWGVHDTLEAQFLDLRESCHPRLRARPAADRRLALADLAAAHLAGVPLSAWGRWVWYPWSGRLVHLLPAEDFHALHLDRNRDKLSSAEFARLRTVTVGVVGLSVGNAVTLTLALEGGCGHLKLADFDRLDLSNMNRMRAGIHDIGLPKTVLAARQIAEIDRYLPSPSSTTASPPPTCTPSSPRGRASTSWSTSATASGSSTSSASAPAPTASRC